MKNVELRWVAERISSSHKSMTLQYRVFKDHGGPYANYDWTEWMTVPTYDVEAEMMSDKGYEVTTHAKQAEFAKKRNYTYDQ
jgi:hypothetical protein